MKRSLQLKSKTEQDAIAKALEQLKVSAEDIEVEVLENPTKGFLGLIGAKDGIYKITVIEKETDIAKSFIENILKNANVDASVNVTQENNLIKVDIEGNDVACLIGRRGET
ncbi:single-stranded DNA-binding protein, partial [Romboutsia weinsteinii]